MQDHFSIASTILPQGTRVASFKGVEGLSTLYSFEVNLLVPNEEELQFEDVMGEHVTLTLQPETGHSISGVIGTFELLTETAGYGVFRATIVPKLWYLTLTHHSRIFTDESVKDVIEKILKANGFTTSDYDFRINATYDKVDHICQYQESDFNFISRWMEREGLYYFFEHDDGKALLVITDNKSFHNPKPEKPVRYVAQMGQDSSANASLDRFVCRYTTLPSKVQLKDYDPLKPKLDVSGSAPVSPAGMGEIHVYGENFLTPADGGRLAKIRSEEFLARQTIYTGEGRVYDLCTGHTFTLEEHPRSAFNTDYLATAVYHYGNQSSMTSPLAKLLDLEFDEAYHVRVEAIPAKVQFRPARTTALPRIYGTEEAVIDAEDGHPYAELDDHGRYKVKIFFDESDLEDGKGSLWIRMLQPHGGDVEGFHFPLRKGTEVHLVFLGGDPDRPVIAGVAHNAHNPSAVTKANSTRNVMQTGGKNRMEMEDNEGGQWMHMKTEPKGTAFFIGAKARPDAGKDGDPPVYSGSHNWQLMTAGDGQLYTYDDMTFKVANGDLHINVVTANMETFVQGKSDHHVVGPVKEDFDNIVEQTYTGAVTQEFKNTVTQTYGQHHKISVEAGGRVEEIKGDFLHKLEGTFWHNVSDLWKLQAKEVVWAIGKDISWTATGNIEFLCNDFSCTRKGAHNEKTTGFCHELYIGEKAEMSLAMVTEVTVGVKNELTLALVSDINVSTGIEVKPFHMHEVEFHKAQHAAHVAAAALAKHNADILMIQSEIATHGATLFVHK